MRHSASRSPAPEPVIAGIRISSGDRLVFPTAALTKLDLVEYYAQIADWMLPHIAGRPLTLMHCPKGIPRGGARKGVECVYLRHGKAWGPKALRRVRIREKTKVGEYLVVDDIAGLIALAQMDVLEIHTWNSRADQLEQPDRVVIDLDPGPHVSWPRVVDAAREVRTLLAGIELDSFVKTTGGRGLHVVVPLAPRANWQGCLAFARAVAETLARSRPETYTARFARAGREDKILIDYLRNNRTNTTIAAYSTRARPEATVSVPLRWNELSAARPPQRWTVSTVRVRLARLRADPWAGYTKATQRIPPHAIAALEAV